MVPAGIEWFNTNEHEIAELFGQFGPEVPKPISKPLSGASPGLSDLVADGAQVELEQDPDSACISIRIIDQQPKDGPAENADGSGQAID